VELVTPEQALAKARAELGEFKDVYDAAFLPASIEVRMKEGFRNPTTVKAVANRISSYPVVDDVRYGEEWVVQLYRIQNIATATGIILGASCATVAIIIIGATIRMSVLARSREISIMRLVGATDGFIRRPFLVEHFLKGIAGGLAALLFTYLAHQAIAQSLHIQTTFFDQRLAIAGIVAGGLIGLFGSVVSVGRQLRRV
jgi:cell division transport system permease protein